MFPQEDELQTQAVKALAKAIKLEYPDIVKSRKLYELLREIIDFDQLCENVAEELQRL